MLSHMLDLLHFLPNKIINIKNGEPGGQNAWDNEKQVYESDSFSEIRLPNVTLQENLDHNVGIITMPMAMPIEDGDIGAATQVLSKLHNLGYVHGDVKRDNFVKYEGNVKLIDFECTRRAEKFEIDDELKQWLT